MGKKGKYASIISREERKKINGFFSTIFLISFFGYGIIGGKIVDNFQLNLFGDSNTVFLLNTYTRALMINMGLISMFLSSAITVVYCYVNQKILCKTYSVIINKYNKYIRNNIIIAGMSFIMVVILFFSYCRIEDDGLYLRDIRTGFHEKKYSWSEVESVKIKYTTSNRGQNISYLIKVDNFIMDAEDSAVTMKKEMFDYGVKELHKRIKENGIQIFKEIETYDDKINKFLNLIGDN